MQKLRYALAGVVTAVWLAGYGLAYFRGTDNPTELSALMAIVLSAAFAGEVKQALKKRLDDEEKK